MNELTEKFLASVSFWILMATNDLIFGIFHREILYSSFAWGFLGQAINIAFFLWKSANDSIEKNQEFKLTRTHYFRAMVSLFASPVLAFAASNVAAKLYPNIDIMFVALFCGFFFEMIIQKGTFNMFFKSVIKKITPENND